MPACRLAAIWLAAAVTAVIHGEPPVAGADVAADRKKRTALFGYLCGIIGKKKQSSDRYELPQLQHETLVNPKEVPVASAAPLDKHRLLWFQHLMLIPANHPAAGRKDADKAIALHRKDVAAYRKKHKRGEKKPEASPWDELAVFEGDGEMHAGDVHPPMVDETRCRLVVPGRRLRVVGSLGQGQFGDVLRVAGDRSDCADLALKLFPPGHPTDILTKALNECASVLVGRASRDLGVLPCYGVVVGRNFSVYQLDQAHTTDTQDVPVAVGDWPRGSDRRAAERGWGVSLLMPVVEGAVDLTTFGHAIEEEDHSKTTGNLVPRAVHACVARAGLYLSGNDIQHGATSPSNILLSGDFLNDPENPRNCLLIDFGMSAKLKHTTTHSSGTPTGMTHPMASDLNGMKGVWTRHAQDLFGLVFSDFQLLAGGDGNPLSRCASGDSGKARRREEVLSESAALHLHLARLLADLTAQDLAGLAAYESNVCKLMLSTIARPRLRRRIERYKPTKRDKLMLARRYAFFGVDEKDSTAISDLYKPLLPLLKYVVGTFQPRKTSSLEAPQDLQLSDVLNLLADAHSESYPSHDREEMDDGREEMVELKERTKL